MIFGWLLFTIAGGFAVYELVIFVKYCINYFNRKPKGKKQNNSCNDNGNIVEVNDNEVE